MTHLVQHVDLSKWPWKVIARQDSYEVVGVPGLSITEMLDRLADKFDHQRLFFVPHQGNDNVLFLGEARGDNAMEVHILSIDGSFKTLMECRRAIQYVQEKTPHRLLLAKTATPGLDSMILRLGFKYDYTIKNHSFLGGDFKYFHLALPE